MSLPLHCPNCGMQIGKTYNDGKEQYYYHDDEGEIMCPSCGTGKEYNFWIMIIIIGWVLFFIALILNVL